MFIGGKGHKSGLVLVGVNTNKVYDVCCNIAFYLLYQNERKREGKENQENPKKGKGGHVSIHAVFISQIL